LPRRDVTAARCHEQDEELRATGELLTAAQRTLDELEQRWLELAELQEG
jgi:hypothetical protein